MKRRLSCLPILAPRRLTLKNGSVRPRAWACSGFYYASGLWKVGVAATVGICLLSILFAGNAAAPHAFRIIGSEFLGGFGIAAVVTAIASILAWRSEQKVWVGSALHLCRRENIWPPACRRGANRVRILLLSAMIYLLLPVAVVLAALFLMALNVFQVPWVMGTAAVVIVVSTLMVGFPIVVLSLSESLTGLIGAASPRECWPEATSTRS